jgi:hypothetical protein
MPPHPILALAKRDDNGGFLFPPAVIVIFVLLGAGFCVACGFAINSAFGFSSDNNNMKAAGAEQMSYMAEVRIRNMEALEKEGRMAWGRGRAQGGVREGEVVYD